MINKSNFNNFREVIIKNISLPVDSILSLGCGLLSFEKLLNARKILGVEWSDERLKAIKDENNAIVLKCDMREIPAYLVDRSFDVITMIDVIEHVTKEDGLKLLKDLESKVKKHIILFIPVEKPYTEDKIKHETMTQAERKKTGLTLGHHLSTWQPSEFDKLGYNVDYSPKYHREKGFGAMVCIKNFS